MDKEIKSKMSKGLPTINADSYFEQSAHNNDQMQKLLETLFPEIKVPYDSIYQFLDYLQETKVNAQILPHVIRGVYNLSIGTGQGQVIIHVKGNITNVQTREQNEDLETKLT